MVSDRLGEGLHKINTGNLTVLSIPVPYMLPGSRPLSANLVRSPPFRPIRPFSSHLIIPSGLDWLGRMPLPACADIFNAFPEGLHPTSQADAKRPLRPLRPMPITSPKKAPGPIRPPHPAIRDSSISLPPDAGGGPTNGGQDCAISECLGSCRSLWWCPWLLPRYPPWSP